MTIQPLLCPLGLGGRWGEGEQEKRRPPESRKFQRPVYPSEDGAWFRFPKKITKCDSGLPDLCFCFWEWKAQDGASGSGRWERQ